jgi:hypothetical protein
LKGIQRNPDNLNGLLWRTRSYISSSEGPPSQSARVMMERVRNETQAILSDLHQLMKVDFVEYQKKVEESDFSLFDEYEEIKLE